MTDIILKPGLMVSLATELRGGISYQRVDLDKGEATARWETTKFVENPEEFRRASQVRSKARAIIAKVCSHTAFGLICPLDREGMLNEATAEAKLLVEEFNRSATQSQIRIFVMRGRIASTDEEATRGLASELQSLIAAMDKGISDLDPEAIRDAADRAKQMTALLSDEQVATVSDAIAQARKAARAITARVEKKGEIAAVVLADVQRGAIEKARMLFLNLDAPAASNEQPVAAAVDPSRFAAINTEVSDAV